MSGWHNPHVKYAPLGYTFNASQYCLACIVEIAIRAMNGNRPDGCQCAECVLDLWAKAKNIADRHDESSFDSSDFPKAIGYHDACQLGCEDNDCSRTDEHEHHESCESCGADICEG